jgi:hypothetical protein
MNYKIRYGVTKTLKGAYSPVIFINDQTSSYSPHTRKTPNGALKLVEKIVQEMTSDYKRFGNTVEITKWEHSIV